MKGRKEEKNERRKIHHYLKYNFRKEEKRNKIYKIMCDNTLCSVIIDDYSENSATLKAL